MSRRNRKLVRLALSATALLAAALPAPASAATHSVYVTNRTNGTISQFNVGAGGALAPKTPATVASGSMAFGLAISPDAKSLYSANEGASSVSQFDIGAGQALTPKNPFTAVTGASPTEMTIAPDGKSAYVSLTSGPSVAQFDLVGGQLAAKSPATLPTANMPFGIALTPDGKNVYVASGFGVSQFDVTPTGLSPKNPPTVTAAPSPGTVAVTPDGKNAYVSSFDAAISQFSIGADGGLVAKNPPSLPAGTTPSFVAVSPDGKSAYVPDLVGSRVFQFDILGDGKLSPKNPPTLDGVSYPYGFAITPDGKSAYVANFGLSQNGTTATQLSIDAAGRLSPKSPATVATETGPRSVAITPDQNPVAAFSASAAPAGSASSFNAATSSDADGSIARYDWDFGDGNSLSNGGATPQHVYPNPGSYNVTLTLTDDEGCSVPVFTGRIASCNGNGARATKTITVADGKVPNITVLTLKPSSFAPAPKGGSVIARKKRARGTKVSFVLSEPASVRFTVERPAKGRKKGKKCVAGRKRGKRCTTYKAVKGSFTVQGKGSANSFKFSGRLNRKKLRRGRYRLVATPTDASKNTGEATRKGFRVVG